MPSSVRTRKRDRSLSQSLESPRSNHAQRTAPPLALRDQDIPHLGQHGPLQQSLTMDRSLVSNSTASLPNQYTVFVSVPQDAPPLPADQTNETYIRGAEFLADGWRREGDIEGRLSDLRKLNKRKRPPVSLSPGTKPTSPPPSLSQVDLTTLWYAAALQHPCLCDLEPSKSSWAPSILPLTKNSLPRLDAQSAHLDPIVGVDIPLWSVNPTVDLDQDADALEDFVHGWQTADVSGWGETSRTESQPSLHRSTCCENVSEEADTTNETPIVRSAKGKGKAPFDQFVPTACLHTSPKTQAISLAEQAKKRKAEWRFVIQSSDSYGKLWEIIPQPYSLDTKYIPGRRSKTPRPPDYILPRYYSTNNPHPFHPHLASYIRERPLNRVYWLIPIHGPVHIPTYSDHHIQPLGKAPIPSSATLQDEDVSDQANRREIQWTPALLAHFWKWFLIPIHADTSQKFGSLSTKISGPKPDPFIDLPEPRPLPPWTPDANPPAQRPIRPESGDHIRIYCDARYALSLRTWLHAVEVDLTIFSSRQPSKDPKEVQRLKNYRLFYKARLCLIGERGQVLIVA